MTYCDESLHLWGPATDATDATGAELSAGCCDLLGHDATEISASKVSAKQGTMSVSSDVSRDKQGMPDMNLGL